MLRSPRRLLPPLVLIASLGITFLSWQHEQHNALREHQATLDFTLRTDASRIEQGMATYRQMLRGVQGLFAASEDVQPYEFRAYIETLKLDANFSGIESIRFLPILPQTENTAQVTHLLNSTTPAEVRLNTLYAPPAKSIPMSTAPLAPHDAEPYANSQSHTVMERARDTDTAVITSKLPVGAGASAQPGFLMYLPLYQKDAPHDTLANRRTNLIGWVEASFRMAKLMASLYGEHQQPATIQIYDGIVLSPQTLLYASTERESGRMSAAATKAERLEYIEMGGRTWTLALNAPTALNLPLDKTLSRLIALTGTGLSLLLAALTWSLVSARERAHALAVSMTAALRKSEARYRHMAQHDVLTSLPNLALFSDRLQQTLITAKRNHTHLAVLFLDLDQFKPINDALGHHVGDLLLKAVAVRLRDCVRESDTVARIGGDEFVLLLPEIDDQQGALALAELVRDALNQPFLMTDGHSLDISSSIGVAIYPEHGDDSAQLLKHADRAMYEAKRHGRNQVQLYQAANPD